MSDESNQELADKWRHIAKCAFLSAEREQDPSGRKLIEHGARIYLNCAEELFANPGCTMTDTERLDYLSKCVEFPPMSHASWHTEPSYLLIALKCGKHVKDIREAIDAHAAQSKE